MSTSSDRGIAYASAVTPPYPYYPYWNGQFTERNPPAVPTQIPSAATVVD